MPEFRTAADYRPTGDQPSAIETLAPAILGGERYSTLLGATGTGKTATMAWIIEKIQRPTLDHRPQQDARRPALQRVPRVLPGQRGRVLRLLLRLLPARGVRPAGRPLHREGLVPERRHRPAAPRRHRRAPLAPRRGDHRLGLLHLRARLARRVPRPRARARRRRGARPRRGAAHARRQPVRAQRHGARPRPLPGQGRPARGAAGERRDRLPRLVLRRRGRADHALRPAHRRGALAARQPDDLPGHAVRDLEADDRARRRDDPVRARGAGEAVRVARTGCSRRTGSASAPSTTSR